MFGAEALGTQGELVVLTFKVLPTASGVSRMTLTGFVQETAITLLAGGRRP